MLLLTAGLQAGGGAQSRNGEDWQSLGESRECVDPAAEHGTATSCLADAMMR